MLPGRLAESAWDEAVPGSPLEMRGLEDAAAVCTDLPAERELLDLGEVIRYNYPRLLAEDSLWPGLR